MGFGWSRESRLEPDQAVGVTRLTVDGESFRPHKAFFRKAFENSSTGQSDTAAASSAKATGAGTAEAAEARGEGADGLLCTGHDRAGGRLGYHVKATKKTRTDIYFIKEDTRMVPKHKEQCSALLAIIETENKTSLHTYQNDKNKSNSKR